MQPPHGSFFLALNLSPSLHALPLVMRMGLIGSNDQADIGTSKTLLLFSYLAKKNSGGCPAAATRWMDWLQWKRGCRMIASQSSSFHPVPHFSCPQHTSRLHGQRKLELSFLPCCTIPRTTAWDFLTKCVRTRLVIGALIVFLQWLQPGWKFWTEMRGESATWRSIEGARYCGWPVVRVPCSKAGPRAKQGGCREQEVLDRKRRRSRVREGDDVARALIQRSYISSSRADEKLYYYVIYFFLTDFALFSRISVEAIVIQRRRASPWPMTQGSG